MEAAVRAAAVEAVRTAKEEAPSPPPQVVEEPPQVELSEPEPEPPPSEPQPQAPSPAPSPPPVQQPRPTTPEVVVISDAQQKAVERALAAARSELAVAAASRP